MKRLLRRSVIAASIGGAALLVATIAGASSLDNGNFETGDFTGWTHATTNALVGDWFVSGKIVTPLSGLSWNGPAEKEFAAVSDSTNPSGHVLYRLIKAGKDTRIEAIVYYRNRTSTFCEAPPSTTSLSNLGVCNQQYRIDILDPSANPWSTNPADILKNLFKTDSTSPKKLRPTEMRFKLGSIKGTVMLRFAEVDTLTQFNASVDNVVINNGG